MERIVSMNGEQRTRRRFTAEYKREAAGLVIDTGRTATAVARELGVGQASLGQWVKLEKTRRIQAGESTAAVGEDLHSEMKRLRKENAELKADNAFLGKAAAFFASTPRNRNDSH